MKEWMIDNKIKDFIKTFHQIEELIKKDMSGSYIVSIGHLIDTTRITIPIKNFIIPIQEKVAQ